MLLSTQRVRLDSDVSCFCGPVGDKTVPSGSPCRKKASPALRFFARAFTQSRGDAGVSTCGRRTFVLQPVLRISPCVLLPHFSWRELLCAQIRIFSVLVARCSSHLGHSVLLVPRAPGTLLGAPQKADTHGQERTCQ